MVSPEKGLAREFIIFQHLPHKRYSPAELLAEIREKMTDMWRTTHRLINGVNVVGELFSATMFDARINPVSELVELESLNVDSKPFQKMYRLCLTLFTPSSTTKCGKVFAYFSIELRDFSGTFHPDKEWMPVMPKHHVVRHGVGLDVVVFERNVEETIFVTMRTKEPAHENVQSSMHVLTDLVLGDSIGKEMGSIATCRLPLVGNNITLPPRCTGCN